MTASRVKDILDNPKTDAEMEKGYFDHMRLMQYKMLCLVAKHTEELLGDTQPLFVAYLAMFDPARDERPSTEGRVSPWLIPGATDSWLSALAPHSNSYEKSAPTADKLRGDIRHYIWGALISYADVLSPIESMRYFSELPAAMDRLIPDGYPGAYRLLAYCCEMQDVFVDLHVTGSHWAAGWDMAEIGRDPVMSV